MSDAEKTRAEASSHVVLRTDGINLEEVIRWVVKTPFLMEQGKKRPKVIAVIGLSDNESRPSFRVARHMQQAGYRILPVNPTVDTVLGERGFASLSEVPGPVDIVQVFRAPEHTPQIAKEIAEHALRLGIKVMWLQESVISKEAADTAIQGGIAVVMDRCTWKEMVRLEDR